MTTRIHKARVHPQPSAAERRLKPVQLATVTRLKSADLTSQPVVLNLPDRPQLDMKVGDSAGWSAKPPRQKTAVGKLLQNVGKAISKTVTKAVEKHLGPYPTAAERADRTAEIVSKVDALGLSADKLAILDQLKRSGASDVDLWHGSHMVFDGDQGKLYEQLRAAEGAEKRTSSHYSGVKTDQFQIMFGAAPLLFGKDQQGNTWLQMEGHAFHSRLHLKHLGSELKDDIEHTTNFLEYAAMGKKNNVGPMGVSPHSEKNDPLHLEFTP